MVFDAKRMEALKKRSLDILEMNRRHKDGYQYTQPSPSTYPYQWLWDSCFHATVLSYFSPEDAKKELRALLSHQFENGMVPHMIYWERGDLINIPWGKEHTSSITQPPVLAKVMWKLFERDHDMAFLKEFYPNLFHFYNYLLTERDPREHNLAGIINPDESGEDNSPRFDTALKLPVDHTLRESLESRIKLVEQLHTCNFDAPFCMKEYFWVKDVPFNAILKENLEALADISACIGYPEEALRYRAHAASIAKAMRERMLEGGVFWSTLGADFSKIKVKTWAIFAPLYAGLLSPTEARVLVDEHLLNPKEFRTTFMVPTVSIDEPSYDPVGFWRGPTWIGTNWFIFHGLLRYNRIDVAERLLESSATLLERSGFREYFHPDTGEGAGAKDFTWGALIVDMFESLAARTA